MRVYKIGEITQRAIKGATCMLLNIYCKTEQGQLVLLAAWNTAARYLKHALKNDDMLYLTNVKQVNEQNLVQYNFNNFSKITIAII